MGWLLRYSASSEIIRKHINMLHHQEINELKVGGPNLQSKEQIGGGIFSKIWFPVTYSIQQMFFMFMFSDVEALCSSFSGLLQEELNFVMEHWNTHCIRKNRFGTVSGRPDALYYLSESFGGTPNLMQNVPDQELQYSWENLIIHEEENVYFEYYVCHE